MTGLTERVTVLIVDDQADLCANLREILQEEGFIALTAGDGAAALALLADHSVDLILSDIAMPRMNGYQFYEQVRANPLWVYIPFLFLSARAMDSDIRYGKELGADDYLTKPVNRDDLLAAVRGKLRRSRQLAPLAAPAPGAPNGDLLAGRLRMSERQHKAWMDDRPLELSAREFRLLLHLAQSAGEVVSSAQLIRISHEIEADAAEASGLLRPFVRSLRRKLGYPLGDEGPIETVRGIGYRFVPPR